LDFSNQKHDGNGKECQKLPRKVLVHRDRVSESQHKKVIEHEIPAFIKVFSGRYSQDSFHMCKGMYKIPRVSPNI